MLALANQRLAEHDAWITARRGKINAVLAKLDSDFEALARHAR